MIDAVITRLKDRVPALRRVEGTRALEEMRKTGRFKHQTPAAFVVPLGLQGGPVQSMTGHFVQGVRETVGVILVIQNNTPVGEEALDQLDAIVKAITQAIAAWTPAPQSTPGVFELARGALVPSDVGTVVYQLDFAINDQLRIAT